jgi:hypothetical protein
VALSRLRHGQCCASEENAAGHHRDAGGEQIAEPANAESVLEGVRRAGSGCSGSCGGDRPTAEWSLFDREEGE